MVYILSIILFIDKENIIDGDDIMRKDLPNILLY